MKYNVALLTSKLINRASFFKNDFNFQKLFEKFPNLISYWSSDKKCLSKKTYAQSCSQNIECLEVSGLHCSSTCKCQGSQ